MHIPGLDVLNPDVPGPAVPGSVIPDSVIPGMVSWSFDPAAARAFPCADAWLDQLSRSALGGAAPTPAPSETPAETASNEGRICFGYSLGGLLGLLHMALHPGCWGRGVFLSPALRLKAHHRLLIRTLGGLVPDGMGLPSLAPPHYRLHPRTTVAGYRGAAELERRLAPHLRRWLAGNFAGLPPLFIAYAPGDELIDTRVLADLALAAQAVGNPASGKPGAVHVHVLDHTPPRGVPVHLGLDSETLGAGEWARLTDALQSWLGAPLPAPSPSRTRSDG